MDDDLGIRRSKIVFLSLLGAAGVLVVGASAFPGTEMRRNLYGDRAACERDYSSSQCEQTNSTGGHGGSGGYGSGSWRGPQYAANRSSAEAYGDRGAGRTGVHASVETSVRGGFGSFGRAMRAIG